MNLELNGYKITLGPKALVFIETSMRGMGEVYCRDQLTLWLAGGKCDPDVTIEGPARFVQRGNEIGLPMTPKAGAAICEEPSRMSQAAPMAAAPADSEWPKWRIDMGPNPNRLVRLNSPTDGYIWRGGGGGELERENCAGWIECAGGAVRPATPAEAAKWLRANGYAKVADELERPATAGLQVWRHYLTRYIVKPDGAIKEAREQGVIA